MLDIDALFYGRKADKKALLGFGFVDGGGAYTYCKDILNGQLKLIISVRDDRVSAEVIDRETDAPYYLFRVEDTEGAFVGEVRAEYEKTLTAISDGCFSRAEPYRESVSKAVINYARKKYGTPLEFLWQDDNAVMRRADNRKWYMAVLKVRADRIGLEGEGLVEIIDLRAPAAEVPKLIDGINYLPAYHMNKKSWITIPLDGRVSAEIVCAFIDISYELAKGNK